MCPYHAWCYDLTGRLTGVPERSAFKDCGLETRNLIELPVEEKYGLIVMSPSPDIPADVDALLGDAAAEIVPFGFDKVHFVKSRSQELPINWKLMLETAMEGYHVIALHGRSLEKLVGKNVQLRPYTYDRFGRHARICGGQRPLLDEANSLDSVDTVFPYVALTNYIYPATYLVFGKSAIFLERVELGSAPGKTILTMNSYAWEKMDDEARKINEATFDGTWEIGIDEDVWVMTTAQRAFDSGYPKTIVYGGVEAGVQDVNAEWDRALSSP